MAIGNVISNVALSIAASSFFKAIEIAIEPDVEQEIQDAFNGALEKWSVNKGIRKSRKDYLKELLDSTILSGEFQNFDVLPKEAIDFISILRKEVCNYTKAYDYLKDKKDDFQFNEIKNDLGVILSGNEDIKKILHDKTDLVEDWNRQLKAFEELILNFKPKTALKLLEDLENQVIEKLPESNPLIQAKIYFLKAMCLGDIGSKEDHFLHYVKAYELDKLNASYQAKAAYSYFKLEDVENSQALINEILEKDRFNALAHATKLLINLNDFEDLVLQIPSIVKKQNEFKRIVFSNLREHEDFDSLIKFCPELILNEAELHVQKKISFGDYKNSIYICEIGLRKYFDGRIIEYVIDKKDESRLVKSILEVLESIKDSLGQTEIGFNKTYDFYYYYLHWRTTLNSDDIVKIREAFFKIGNPGEAECMLFAIALFQIDQWAEAYELLRKFESQSVRILHLESYCAFKLNDVDLLVDITNDIFKKSQQINDFEAFVILQNFRLILSIGSLSKIDINTLETVNFESDWQKTIITVYYNVIQKKSNPSESDIQNFLMGVNSYESIFKATLLEIAFEMEYFKLAIDIYKKSQAVFSNLERKYYIYALGKLRNSPKELLFQLEKWRIDGLEYDFEMSNYEVINLEQIRDWKKCYEAATYGFSNDSEYEYFLSSIFTSAYHLDKRELIETYVKVASSYSFKDERFANNVIRILIHFEYFDEGIDLSYKWAKEKDNKASRAQYFSVFLGLKDYKKYLKQYDVVNHGNYVLFQRNGGSQTVRKVNDQEDGFSEFVIGKNAGDKIELPQPFGNKKYTIKLLQVINAYEALRQDIMKESDDPYSGLGIQSFHLSDFDNDPLKAIESIVGGSNEPSPTEVYSKYYDGEYKFSQLPWILPELRNNLVYTFYKLKIEQKGLLLPNPKWYSSVKWSFQEVILDITSIMSFYELEKQGVVQWKSTFKVARFLYDQIVSYQTEYCILQVGTELVLNARYYSDLIGWIHKNCDLVSPRALLEIPMGKSIANCTLAQYLAHQMSLTKEFKNAIMISDDLVLYELISPTSGKIIGARDYIKLIT